MNAKGNPMRDKCGWVHFPLLIQQRKISRVCVCDEMDTGKISSPSKLTRPIKSQCHSLAVNVPLGLIMYSVEIRSSSESHMWPSELFKPTAWWEWWHLSQSPLGPPYFM